jgi:hypothetical protein
VTVFAPSRTAASVVAVALAGLLAGCGAGRSAGYWGEDQGSVEADLSTVGSDGATYSLPPGTTITFAQTIDGSTSTTTEVLSTGVPTQTFWLPPGEYGVTLSQGSADAGSTWTLQRAGDGGPTSIPAVLGDSLPISVTVTAGQATSLVFHFLTPTLGDVTLGTGGVEAGVALDAGAFPLSTGTSTGTASMSVEMLNGSTTLNNALRFSGSVSVSYTLSITRSGAWVMASDQACAPVSATASATSKNAALSAIVSETSGGSGTICFGDGTLSGAFNLHLSRTGAPTTSTMKTDLPRGGTFEVELQGLAPEVYSGTTLRLSSLPEPFTVTAAALSETISSGTTVLANVDSTPSGTSSVTLHP